MLAPFQKVTPEIPHDISRPHQHVSLEHGFSTCQLWQVDPRYINPTDIKTCSVRLKGILGIETKDDTGDVSIPDFVSVDGRVSL